MIKSLFSYFLIFAAFAAWAQPNIAPTKKIEGKTFYVHTVSKGQTVYGISKMYDVGVNDIYDQNPSSKSGLKIGQTLYIPSTIEDTPEVIQPEPATNVINEDIIHTVASGETLYFLAKKYGVAVEEIKKANNLTSNSLSVGQKLIIPIEKANTNNETTPIVKDIPNPSVAPGDSVIVHKVKKGETFYSLTRLYQVTEQSIREANEGLPNGLKKGDKIRIVVKKKAQPQIAAPIENLASDSLINTMNDTIGPLVAASTKEEYTVTIFLPFMFEENAQFRAKCPPIGDCPHFGYTTMSLAYYNGFMMAADSLRKAGLNLKIRVIDTKNDEEWVKSHLNDQLAGSDMIFGPLFPKNIKTVSQFAKKHQIQMILPLPITNKALYKNEYVSKYISSNSTKLNYLGEYVAKRHAKDNVMMIKNHKSDKDSYYASVFEKSYNANLTNDVLNPKDSLRVLNLSSSTSKLANVQTYSSATDTNILVVPSSDLGFVSNFITKLSTTTNPNPYSRYVYKVYGMEEWIDFETIDEKYKNRYNVTMATGGRINYDSQIVKDFIVDYRTIYKTDPSKYAFVSFDAAFTNLKGLLLFGPDYRLNYTQIKNDQSFFTNSNYIKVNEDSGYENRSPFIITYDDYEIKRVD